MCIKNHNIWCTVPEMQSETNRIFCHFEPFLAPLPTPCPTPPTSLMIPKVKILGKKWEKYLEIISFYTYMCTINEDHYMIYGSWNIRCNWQKYLSFWGPFLPFQLPGNLENLNFNIEKNTWRYYHFIHLHYKWYMIWHTISYDVWFLRYGAQKT